MKPTQKNQQKSNNQGQKKSEWQIPERAQVYVTPGAQKSIDDAARRGETPKIATDRRGKAPNAPANVQKEKPQPKAADIRSASVNARKTPASVKKPAKKEPLTLKEAVFAEIRDRLRTIRLGIQVNAEDIIRGVICGALMLLFALLQTTFFVRFAPFGKVPDLMLIFVLAIGVYEGEKWGSIVGLIAAFVIQAMGYGGGGPEILSIIYMPVGCAAGLLSKYYLRHTLPVKALYVAVAAFIRSVATVICALFVLDASVGQIIARIAIPEYFSTVLLSPVPFFIVWLSFRHFHKTRAERTDNSIE